MIKGLTSIVPVASPEAFERLASLLRALGFEEGRPWDDGAGRGAPMLAPLGNLELVNGRLPASPQLLIETTALDAVHSTVGEWLRGLPEANAVPSAGNDVPSAAGDAPSPANSAQSPDKSKSLGEIEETPWKSRLFSVQLAPDFELGFWESLNPLHGQPVAVEGDLSAAGKRFAIVVARWNAVITDRLLQGSLDGLYRSGAAKKDVEIVRVPGAWEIPSAARTLAETGRFDAVITLGVLLRGETAHYEAIYTEVARGIGQSQQETGVPHAFGVLTCETLEQALDRAGLKAGNKGFEAAVAAIEMASLQAKLRGNEPRAEANGGWEEVARSAAVGMSR